jgi:hypothetical protein
MLNTVAHRTPSSLPVHRTFSVFVQGQAIGGNKARCGDSCKLPYSLQPMPARSPSLASGRELKTFQDGLAWIVWLCTLPLFRREGIEWFTFLAVRKKAGVLGTHLPQGNRTECAVLWRHAGIVSEVEWTRVSSQAVIPVWDI